jgi:predicted nucleic acid-binding protein
LIYLDTSAFIKLYLREEGSAEVQQWVIAQNDPLPVWHILELELLNALRFKVFLGEMAAVDTEKLIGLYLDRKRMGQYHTPYLDPIQMHGLALQMTARTPHLGCRSLDILHVAAARLLEAERFITADQRQASLAKGENLTVALIGTD